MSGHCKTMKRSVRFNSTEWACAYEKLVFQNMLGGIIGSHFKLVLYITKTPEEVLILKYILL